MQTVFHTVNFCSSMNWPPFAACQEFHEEKQLSESSKETLHQLEWRGKTLELCPVFPDHYKTKCKSQCVLSFHFNCKLNHAELNVNSTVITIIILLKWSQQAHVMKTLVSKVTSHLSYHLYRHWQPMCTKKRLKCASETSNLYSRVT